MNIKNDNRLNLKFVLLLFAMTLTIASCATHKGYFGIGSPVALSPTKTKGSLSHQKDIVSNPETLQNISFFAVNEGHLRSSSLSQRAKISASPAGEVAPTSNVDQEVENATEISETIQPEYHALVMDGFTNLESYSAHETDISEDFDIDIMKKGEDGTIYKVKFDLSINPLRQDYWTYIWRGFDFFNGLKNYTKDYLAEIDFTLKDPKAKVVLVQPVNEGANSFEMTLMQKTSQLAGGGTFQGVAAELDLAERHREQLTQQRKNPILRGTVDSDITFHYTISPRQYVAQRTFRIPFFMSRYSIERGLDSGLQFPVSAYILVTDENQETLNLDVCGYYKKLGDPRKTTDKKNNFIPYRVDSDGVYNKKFDEKKGAYEEEYCKPITLTLPKNKTGNPVVIASKDWPNRIDISWGKSEIKITPDCSIIKKESRAVKLGGIDLKIGDAALKEGRFNGKTLYWIEPTKKATKINGKKFLLHFCSKDKDGVVINEIPSTITYVTKDVEQHTVTVEGKAVASSKSGQQIKISIYGMPGKKLELKEIKFGNKSITKITDMNDVDHIYEFDVIVPDFKGTQIPSIVVVKKDGSTITIAQEFTIN
ncbi:MAG: hypothetical protein GQ475_01700 [Methylococcaceae bacterium]|nr:hypothetical protein [Methylococcaceae bacterium]